MKYFKNNLIDINEDSMSYETHSFRCEDCQYLSNERKWEIWKLYDREEWSLNFDNMMIVRYLLSWNDCSIRLREDFMNLEK